MSLQIDYVSIVDVSGSFLLGFGVSFSVVKPVNYLKQYKFFPITQKNRESLTELRPEKKSRVS